MKKTISIIAIIGIILCGAFWAKGYYNDRYVISDSFYTQIPLDEKNEDSWLKDANGVQQEKGKEYNLLGFNQNGDERKVRFIKRGTSEDYYEPGTFIKVDVSKTLEIGVSIVEKDDVPEKALEKLTNHQ